MLTGDSEYNERLNQTNQGKVVRDTEQTTMYNPSRKEHLQKRKQYLIEELRMIDTCLDNLTPETEKFLDLTKSLKSLGML